MCQSKSWGWGLVNTRPWFLYGGLHASKCGHASAIHSTGNHVQMSATPIFLTALTSYSLHNIFIHLQMLSCSSMPLPAKKGCIWKIRVQDTTTQGSSSTDRCSQGNLAAPDALLGLACPDRNCSHTACIICRIEMHDTYLQYCFSCWALISLPWLDAKHEGFQAHGLRYAYSSILINSV